MKLHIRSYGAEPYPLTYEGDLESAVAYEANVVASDAGSELLDEGTDEERQALADRVSREALAALVRSGDSYRDPTGVVWVLEGDESDDE